MTSTSTEHVLVVPTERFEALGYFQGFTSSQLFQLSLDTGVPLRAE